MTQQRSFLDDIDPLQGFQGGSPTPPIKEGGRTGEQRKKIGMAKAAAAKSPELEHARRVARAIALNKGTVTADDVAEALKKGGKKSLGPAAGSIFVGDEWQWTGTLVKSERPEANQNLLRVWRLKDA